MKEITLIYGVGYIGEGAYKSKVNGKHSKIYNVWHNILQRCYDENYHKTRPAYKGCTVDKSWYNFQNFAKWYEDNYVGDHPLDKDILFRGNKIYSPETCCFVPREINSLLLNCRAKRGEYPIGVCKIKNKFQAQVLINGKRVHLGLFNTPEEAFKAYKIAKEIHIKEVTNKWRPYLTEPCYQALINYKIEIND